MNMQSVFKTAVANANPRGNIIYKHSVTSGVFYEGAIFMINGLP